MVEAGRSNSRGKHRAIDPSFDNSPYLSSPIRPIPSTTSGGVGVGKNRQAQSSNGKGQTQPNEDVADGIAPLRDITVSSKSPTSLLRSTSRSRSAGRQRDAEVDNDGCSLADSTICTNRTATKGNAPSCKSPYLMGAGATNTYGSGGSTSAKRVGRGAKATSKTAKKMPLPKLLLMPDEIDEMLLEFKQRQHEEGKLLLRNTGEGADDGDGNGAGVDDDEEYSSDEDQDDSSSKVSSSSSSSEE